MNNDPRIDTTISHYRITSRLGGGAMGIVYKAEDLKLKRTVALKFLSSALLTDDETKTRFMNEARAASALDHPRIGTIFEIEETEDGEMFIAMAYYDGKTLKQKMEEEELAPEDAIQNVRQIANGLSEAHKQDIVHRDVKPANIIITSDGFVKIVDFGIAKLGGSTRLTKAGTTMGTPAYMSPEQARGEEADSRSDIWSLGVIFYELLAGQLPFKGRDEMSVLFNIVNTPADFDAEASAIIPAEIKAILEKALAKKREDRYSDIDSMLDDLLRAAPPQQITTDQIATIVQPARLGHQEEKPRSPAGGYYGPASKGKNKRRKVILATAGLIAAVGLIAASLLRKNDPDNIGFIKVESNPPGAEVLLDNKPTGARSPALLGPFQEGSYALTLALTGYDSASQTITLANNDTISSSFELNTLTLVSDLNLGSTPPGAAIFLDGMDTGLVTPALLEAVVAGNHEVRLEKTGFQTVSKTMSAAPKQVADWTPKLTKLVPARKKTRTLTERSQKKEKIPQMGTLVVDSQPEGAEIFIDEVATAEVTPAAFPELAVGQHSVRLARAGYNDVSTQIEIEPQKEAKVAVQLAPKEKGQLTVIAMKLEGGAEVSSVANILVNGNQLGQTPISFSLEEGEYTVEAKLFGYVPKEPEQKVMVRSGQRTTLKFQFTRTN